MTTTIYEIPTSPSPQTFSVQLQGITYRFGLWYHPMYVPWGTTAIERDTGNTIDTGNLGGWTLDLADADNNPLVCGIPLNVGVSLLEQYPYLNFPGVLYVGTDGSTSGPTFEGLGVTGHLYFAVYS